MGMYTQLHLGAWLEKSVPPDVVLMLAHLCDPK